MSKIFIKIDPEVASLIPKFLENRRKDLGTLELGVQKQDFQGLEDLGHKLKGTCGAYGFHRLSVIGKIIEEAAYEKNLNGVQEAVAEMKDFMSRVEVVYES